jgi:hypothetical protein
MQTRRGRPFWLSAALAIGLAVALRAPTASAVSGEQVRRAVARGIEAIKRRQQADGSWPNTGRAGGCTALCTLALLTADVPPADPAVRRGLAAVRRIPNQATYVVGLKIMALAAADPTQYAADIRRAANWLVEAQVYNGGAGKNGDGMWTYGQPRGGRTIVRNGRRIVVARTGSGDNSNTQFALLGLAAAYKAGAHIPEGTWRRAEQHLVHAQGADGGWHYQYRPRGRSYGSMTGAGVAGLFITGQALSVSQAKGFVNGAAPNCGQYRQNEAVAAGLKWLGKHFDVSQNPGRGGRWHHYWLYAAERCGVFSGQRFFGTHDWYREMAEHLVRTQRPNGSWSHALYDDAFAILVLAKGHRPALLAKLRHAGEWNRNRYDIEHLVEFIGDKLGERVGWQVVSLDAPLEDLVDAPILFFNGHSAFPSFTAAQKWKLRACIEQGATIFAEACCGQKVFDAGFRAFCKEMFPEYPLKKLPLAHPIFKSLYTLDETYDLEGMEVGCRTSIIYSPRALSTLWEQTDVPKWSQFAFKLGTNIAAYVTGKNPLKDKLERATIVRREQIRGRIIRGALQFAQVIHTGDCKPVPNFLPRLALRLGKQANVETVPQTALLKLTDTRIFQHPILFMHGHFSFKLSEDEKAGLKRYLQRGGFLFAEACCGRKAFDTSFRALMRELFPDRPLERLPASSPILNGTLGYAIREVKYRRAVAEEFPDLKRPVLEALADADGRPMVLYSKFSIARAGDDVTPYGCRGYSKADAERIATNIVLYALNF